MTHRSRPGEPVAKKASTWVNPEANYQRPNATGRFLGAQVLRYAPWLRGVGIVRASFSGRARSPREPAGLRQVSEPHRLGTMMESYGNLRELSNGLVEPKRRVPPLPLSEPSLASSACWPHWESRGAEAARRLSGRAGLRPSPGSTEGPFLALLPIQAGEAACCAHGLSEQAIHGLGRVLGDRIAVADAYRLGREIGHAAEGRSPLSLVERKGVPAGR